jgi:hypothetical protein
MITATAYASASHGRTYAAMEETFATVADAKLFISICGQLGHFVQIGGPRELSECDLRDLDVIGVGRN